jgi:hypothetical protein
MFYTFQATTRPPRCHQLPRYEGNGKRVTTLWVVLEAKVVTRTECDQGWIGCESSFV